MRKSYMKTECNVERTLSKKQSVYQDKREANTKFGEGRGLAEKGTFMII